jgi:hypothetical protein
MGQIQEAVSWVKVFHYAFKCMLVIARGARIRTVLEARNAGNSEKLLMY